MPDASAAPPTVDDFLRLADALPTETRGTVGPAELRREFAPAFETLEAALEAGVAQFYPVDEDRLAAAFARMRMLCEVIDMPHWRGRLEYNAARIWQARGRYDRAEAILVEFRAAYPAENSAHTLREDLLAQLLWLRGAAALALSVLKDAEDYLRGWDPLELTETQRQVVAAGLAQIRGIRGEIYFQNGLIEAADAELDREWEAAEQCGYADAELNALLRQGEFASSIGKPARTITRVDDFLTKLGEPADDDGRAQRARLLLCKGQAEAAAESADPTREPRASDTLESALQTLQLDHSNRVAARLVLFSLALRAAERSRGEPRRAALDAAVVHAREWQRVCAEARAASGGGDSLARYEAVFTAFETELALLRDAPLENLREQLDRHDADFEELLGQWRSFDLRRGGIGFLHHDDRRTVLGSLIDLNLRVAAAEARDDGPARALGPVLAAHEQTTLQRQRQGDAGPCSLAAVRTHLLDRGNGALAYVATVQRTHLFAVDAHAVVHHKLPGRLELLRPIRALRDLLRRDPAETRTESAAEQLADASQVVRELLLPADVEKRILGWTGVTVLGADALGDLPFEALVLSDDRLLGEAVPVDSLPSFALGVTLAREADRSPPRSALRLAFAGTLTPSDDVLAAKEIARAPFPRDAADGILAGYDEDARLPLLDADATRAALLDLDLSDRDVVHVVAHGLRRTDVELGRGLALSDAPLWHDDVIDELRSAPRGLVVLSACSSGRGESRVGEGGHLTDLGGAFLWRGARVVALSQVDILAGRHLRLIEQFHHGLAKERLSPAAAMQRARAALRREDDGAARFYFAQMQVAGLGQRPLAAE